MSKNDENQTEDSNPFDELFEEVETHTDYWVSKAQIRFTEEIVKKMEELKLSRRELASKMEVKPGFITRILKGQNNFELKTMVRLARALDSEVYCGLVPTENNYEFDEEEIFENRIFQLQLNSDYLTVRSPIENNLTPKDEAFTSTT